MSATRGHAGESARFRVSTAAFVSGATDARSLPPPTAAEVAFAGRSNVGKSTLLNTMLDRRNLVRTSRTPGCTRQINVFEAKIAAPDEMLVHLVDLPGYGYAKRSKAEKGEWGPMLEGYLRRRSALRGVVVLVDVRRGVEDDDRELLDFVRAPRDVPEPVRSLVVATKLDKLPLAQRKPALDAVRRASGEAVIGFSGVTGDGRAALWSKIRAWL